MKIVRELSIERVLEGFPIEHEPRIEDLNTPLIIESACPGWQKGGDRFPAIPISIKDQSQEIIDSIKAGAVIAHVHPRDPDTGTPWVDEDLMKRVMDPVFSKYDCITLQHSWVAKENKGALEVDYITETEKLLEIGKGNRYCQGSAVTHIDWVSMTTGARATLKGTQEGVKWLESVSITPVYQLFDTYALWSLKQHIFDTGISKKTPYILNIHAGKHHSHAVFQSPWSFINVTNSYSQAKQAYPTAVLGVYPGGRNWLPILCLGLLLGTSVVRVGVEDCYWIYPHKDDIIKKNSHMVDLVVEIATRLGRRIVTDVSEARRILGVRLTSQ
jgi:3-keto-5-aminohexanoate cleavage enzyme